MTPALPIQAPVDSPSVTQGSRPPGPNDTDRALSDFKPALNEARRHLAGREDRSRRQIDDRTSSRPDRGSDEPNGLRNRRSRQTADREPAMEKDRSARPVGEDRIGADQRKTNQATEDANPATGASETTSSTTGSTAEPAPEAGETDPSQASATSPDAVILDDNGPDGAEAETEEPIAINPESGPPVDEQAPEGSDRSAVPGETPAPGQTNPSSADQGPRQTEKASEQASEPNGDTGVPSGRLTTDTATEDRTVDPGPPRSIASDDDGGQSLEGRAGTKGGPDRSSANPEAGRTDLDLSIVDAEPGTTPDPLGPQTSGLTPGTSRRWAAQSAAVGTGSGPAQTIGQLGDVARGGAGDIAPAELPGVVTPSVVETTSGTAMAETVTTTSRAESTAPASLSGSTNPTLAQGLTEEAAAELWGQVQRALARARTGGGGQEVRVRLRPAELGELLVQVSTQGDQLNVRLVTSSAAAQQTLLDDQQRLAAELAQAGFSDGMVDISHQGSGQQPDSDGDGAPAGAENTVGNNGVLHARRRPLAPGINFGDRRDASINLTL